MIATVMPSRSAAAKPVRHLIRCAACLCRFGDERGPSDAALDAVFRDLPADSRNRQRAQ